MEKRALAGVRTGWYANRCRSRHPACALLSMPCQNATQTNHNIVRWPADAICLHVTPPNKLTANWPNLSSQKLAAENA
jgi:hypothetical protein